MGNSISLSLRWRQRGSRYAIRAGRNLPDKEFRYLRTVIVTAAVYWGFWFGACTPPLTFQHRAGVRPYTSPYGFAETCVLVNSRHPWFVPPPWLPKDGASFSEVTEAFCRVPSTQFSQAPWYALPVHLCRFRVRSDGGLFPGTASRPDQSDKVEQQPRSVTSSWPRNINPVPIDYAFRPRLRGRLTLLRLALSRNPWTFGDRVSPCLSLLMSTFSLLIAPPVPHRPASQPNCVSASKSTPWAYLSCLKRSQNGSLKNAPHTTRIAVHPELRLVA